MIDLGVAYNQLDSVLARHGLAHCAYALTVTAWNHRHNGEGQPIVSFTASALVGPDCIQAHGCETLDAALAEVDRLLTAREPAAPLVDLRVDVPVPRTYMDDLAPDRAGQGADHA